ncbi:hypothetical protein ACFSM5_13290 [Lacibacterium aquatile]|uniref:Uncharacterized protein n=1 Tax=Lacibacterium aquatile TaxID=1168082 RepID=A0ABW5DSR8_9PROT
MPNRYTRAISRVGFSLGFENIDLIVLTAGAQPADFGQLLGDRRLWKDSFALGHGEFPHSYQWLAAGLFLKWGKQTATLYKNTKGRFSHMPFWVKGDKPGLELRPALLWEYMVDCTLYRDAFQPKVEIARKWVDDSFVTICNGPAKGFETGHFWFLNFLTGKIGFEPLMMKPDEHIPPEEIEEIRKQPPLREELILKYDKALQIVSEKIVAFFPLCNALAAKGVPYRNANNVTDLARSQGKWFICAYETRRTGKLLKGQNDLYIDGIKKYLMGSNFSHLSTVVYTIKDLNGSDLELKFSGKAVLNFWLKLEAKYGKSLSQDGTTRGLLDDFWEFMLSGGQNLNTKQLKDLPGKNPRLFPSPMDALSSSRNSNYTNNTKKLAGWDVRAQGIFKIDIKGIKATKKQIKITFHDEPGLINEFTPLD